MQALIVVDAQNEFSPEGLRPVPDHSFVIERILRYVEEARREQRPIAFFKHYNKPHQPRAFVPKTWGAELSPGIGPKHGYGPEKLFKKDLYGAFTFTGLHEWLREHGADEVMIVGFFTHMCVATTAHEAIVRGFKVYIDPYATGARDIEHPVLGRLSYEEVRRTAMIQLYDVGVNIVGVNDCEGLRLESEEISQA